MGGTKVDNDWYPVARPETTTEILTRALALCPELAPPEVRATRQPIVDDLRPIVIEEGCGFRPVRKGGIRLDGFWHEGSSGKIPIVCNYGYAPNPSAAPCNQWLMLLYLKAWRWRISVLVGKRERSSEEIGGDALLTSPSPCSIVNCWLPLSCQCTITMR